MKPSSSSRSSACSARQRLFLVRSAGLQAARPASSSSSAPVPGGSGRTLRTSPAGDEEAVAPAGLGGRCDQARPQLSQPLEPGETLDDLLERLDPVAEPCGLLVAEALGEVREPVPQARERPAFEQALELLVRGRGQRAGGQAGLPPAADRPERARLLRDHEVVAPAPEVDAALAAAGCASSRAARAPGSAAAPRARPRAPSRARATRSGRARAAPPRPTGRCRSLRK